VDSTHGSSNSGLVDTQVRQLQTGLMWQNVKYESIVEVNVIFVSFFVLYFR